MFGIFCYANGVFIIFFIKETKGRTLEEMDVLFGLVSEDQRKADIDHALQKGLDTEHVDAEHVEPRDEELGKTVKA